jgi:hypothetical protein
MATENQAWMYPSTTKSTLTPTQLALQERLNQQAEAEAAARMAAKKYDEYVYDVYKAGGTIPPIERQRTTTSTTTSGASGNLLSALNLFNFGGGGSTRKRTNPSITIDYSGDGKNVDQLRAMYASALAELQRQQGEGGQTILGSVDRMRNDPMNTANAYAGLRASAPNVVGNPLAEYAQATGISTDMANKSQALANADAQAYQGAVQNVYDIMSASQQAANQARMADIGMIETGANQDLVTQANMLKLLLNQRETADVVALQQRNLENAINQRNIVTQQIQSFFGDEFRNRPEELLALIEATLAKINTGQWGSGATA